MANRGTVKRCRRPFAPSFRDGLKDLGWAAIVATRPQFKRSFAAYCFPGSARGPACRLPAGLRTPNAATLSSPEFRSHRKRVAPFSSPTGNAAVPFSAKWRASLIPSLKALYDLHSHASLKLRFRDGVGAGTRVFSRDSSAVICPCRELSRFLRLQDPSQRAWTLSSIRRATILASVVS